MWPMQLFAGSHVSFWSVYCCHGSTILPAASERVLSSFRVYCVGLIGSYMLCKFTINTEGIASMRYALLLPVVLLGLAGCVAEVPGPSGVVVERQRPVVERPVVVERPEVVVRP
jgi:hypothetical protein